MNEESHEKCSQQLKSQIVVLPWGWDHWVDLCNSTRDLTAKWGSGDNFSVHKNSLNVSSQLSEEWPTKGKGESKVISSIDFCSFLKISNVKSTFQDRKAIIQVFIILRSKKLQRFSLMLCKLRCKTFVRNICFLKFLSRGQRQFSWKKLWRFTRFFLFVHNAFRVMRGTLAKVFGI